MAVISELSNAQSYFLSSLCQPIFFRGSFPPYLSFFLCARRFPICFDLEVLHLFHFSLLFSVQHEDFVLRAAMKIFSITVLLSFAVIPVLAAPNVPLVGRDVDPTLVPEFGHQAGLNPTGTGDCDGITNPAGVVVKIPCFCPPTRADFLQVSCSIICMIFNIPSCP